MGLGPILRRDSRRCTAPAYMLTGGFSLIDMAGLCLRRIHATPPLWRSVVVLAGVLGWQGILGWQGPRKAINPVLRGRRAEASRGSRRAETCPQGAGEAAGAYLGPRRRVSPPWFLVVPYIPPGWGAHRHCMAWVRLLGHGLRGPTCVPYRVRVYVRPARRKTEETVPWTVPDKYSEPASIRLLAYLAQKPEAKSPDAR